MSPGFRGREDQRRSELSVCPSLNSRLQSLWGTLRKECLWSPYALLFEAHAVPMPAGLCPLTQISLWTGSTLPVSLSFINTHTWAPNPQGHVHQWQVMDKETLQCLNGWHRANFPLCKHIQIPSYAANSGPILLATEWQISLFSQTRPLVELGLLMVRSECKEQKGRLQCLGVRELPCCPYRHCLVHSFVWMGALTPRKASLDLAVGQAGGKGLESCWSGPRPQVPGYHPLAACFPDIKLNKPVVTFP